MTSTFNGTSTFKTKKKLKVFKNSKISLFLGLLLALGLISLLLFGLPKGNENNMIYAAILYNAALFIIITVLYRYNYSHEHSFTIYVDIEGIQISDEQLFKWDEIKATAIISYPGKGQTLDKLVVLLKNDIYFKYDLLHFDSFEGIGTTISKYIEFFKQKNFAQQGVCCNLGLTE